MGPASSYRSGPAGPDGRSIRVWFRFVVLLPFMVLSCLHTGSASERYRTARPPFVGERSFRNTDVAVLESTPSSFFTDRLPMLAARCRREWSGVTGFCFRSWGVGPLTLYRDLAVRLMGAREELQRFLELQGEFRFTPLSVRLSPAVPALRRLEPASGAGGLEGGGPGVARGSGRGVPGRPCVGVEFGYLYVIRGLVAGSRDVSLELVVHVRVFDEPWKTDVVVSSCRAVPGDASRARDTVPDSVPEGVESIVETRPAAVARFGDLVRDSAWRFERLFRYVARGRVGELRAERALLSGRGSSGASSSAVRPLVAWVGDRRGRAFPLRPDPASPPGTVELWLGPWDSSSPCTSLYLRSGRSGRKRIRVFRRPGLVPRLVGVADCDGDGVEEAYVVCDALRAPGSAGDDAGRGVRAAPLSRVLRVRRTPLGPVVFAGGRWEVRDVTPSGLPDGVMVRRIEFVDPDDELGIGRDCERDLLLWCDVPSAPRALPWSVRLDR